MTYNAQEKKEKTKENKALKQRNHTALTTPTAQRKQQKRQISKGKLHKRPDDRRTRKRRAGEHAGCTCPGMSSFRLLEVLSLQLAI